MGLLDGMIGGLGSDEGLLGLYLMAAGAPKAGGRTSLGEGLLGGLQDLQQRRQGRDDRVQKQRQQEMQMALMQAQIGETQAQAAQRAAAAAQAQRQQQEQQRIQVLLRGSGGQVTPGQANAASGIAGPRPEELGAVGQRRPIDYQDLIRQGVPPELVKQLAESQNFGRQEVGRVEETMADGRPVRQQFDKFGTPIGGALPQWKAPIMSDTGGAINAIDPASLAVLQRFQKSNSPGELLSAQTSMRGQNMSDARSREKNSIDQAAVGKVDWKQDVNGAWVGLPKEVKGTGPVTPVTTAGAGKREQQARNAVYIINEAEKLIDKGTGSYLGAGVDIVGKAFGGATPGAVAGGQLKALEGALMMAQPRMEGPQSNLDVQLYRQMAAQIGDPTVPPKIKKAALATVKSLHEKYTGQAAAQPSGASGQWSIKKVGP